MIAVAQRLGVAKIARRPSSASDFFRTHLRAVLAVSFRKSLHHIQCFTSSAPLKRWQRIEEEYEAMQERERKVEEHDAQELEKAMKTAEEVLRLPSREDAERMPPLPYSRKRRPAVRKVFPDP